MKNKSKAEMKKAETDEDKLYLKTVNLILYARGLAVKKVNFIQWMTYYSIGRWIVEQQKGSSRAKYRQYIINNLSKKLLNDFGWFFLRHVKNC